MIRIFAEATNATTSSGSAAGILDPYKDDFADGAQITQLQTAITALEGALTDPNQRAIIKTGVQTIASALSDVRDKEKSNAGADGWRIFYEDDKSDEYDKAILTVSEVREWILRYGIQMDKIRETLNAIHKAGEKLVQAIENHNEENEIQKKNVGFEHIEISNSANKQIVEALYQQGSKGRGWNSYGSYERLLSIMTGGIVFPQDGSEGAGDISLGRNLIEVKCIDGDTVKTTPQVPAAGGSCLIMVKTSAPGNHYSFDVLIFKNDDVLKACCKSVRNKKSGEVALRSFKELMDKKGVFAGSPFSRVIRNNNFTQNQEKYRNIKTAVDEWILKNLNGTIQHGTNNGITMFRQNTDSPAAKQRQGIFTYSPVKLDTMVTNFCNWYNDVAAEGNFNSDDKHIIKKYIAYLLKNKIIPVTATFRAREDGSPARQAIETWNLNQNKNNWLNNAEQEVASDTNQGSEQDLTADESYEYEVIG